MNHSAHIIAYKHAAAIKWLQDRGKHCFTTPLEKSIYTPVCGTPLMPKGVK